MLTFIPFILQLYSYLCFLAQHVPENSGTLKCREMSSGFNVSHRMRLCDLWRNSRGRKYSRVLTFEKKKLIFYFYFFALIYITF